MSGQYECQCGEVHRWQDATKDLAHSATLMIERLGGPITNPAYALFVGIYLGQALTLRHHEYSVATATDPGHVLGAELREMLDRFVDAAVELAPITRLELAPDQVAP